MNDNIESKRQRGGTMDRIERINQAGTAYLIAETDYSSLRIMGGVGRKVRDAKEAAQKARDELVAVFQESGYTVEELEELEHLTMPDGSPVLGYGIIDVLKRYA